MVQRPEPAGGNRACTNPKAQIPNPKSQDNLARVNSVQARGGTRMLRFLFLTAALAIAAAAGFAAQGSRTPISCDDTWNDRRETFCEIREETLTGIGTIDVDATPNGGIRVGGWDRGDVQVRSRVTASADTEREARSLVSAVTISTAGGRVRADGPANGRDEYWSVSF